MAVHQCSIIVNDKMQELNPHGTPKFPCGCYETYVDDSVTCQVTWHWHEELELILIHQGEARITAGQGNYVLKAGEGIFINSNVLHSGHGTSSDHCVLHSFVFHPTLLTGSMDTIFMEKYMQPLISCTELPSCVLKPGTPWQRQVLESIEKAYEITRSEAYGYEFMVRNLLSDVCMQIINNNRLLLSDQVTEGKLQTNRIKVMLNYIHQHYPETLELKHIADSVNVSSRECLRSFHEILGISPMQYLIKYRISTAVQLLAETDDSITEICIRCGFPSPSYFTKMFKRHIGTTPSEYRKQL